MYDQQRAQLGKEEEGGAVLVDGAGAQALPRPYYFDDKTFLRHYQTDTTIDTESAIKGDLGPELLEYINEYVQEKLESEHGMIRTYLPSANAPAKCDIFVPTDWATCDKLLVMVQSKRHNEPGVWSRGLCISHGLNVGSMLPYVAEARKSGFGVIILNPRKNSVMQETKAAVYGADGVQVSEAETQKLVIEGSESPEKHLSFVWDNFVAKSSARSVCFLAFDEGRELVGTLLKEKQDQLKADSRIKALAFVEPQKSFGVPVPAVESFLTERTVVFERLMKSAADVEMGNAPSVEGAEDYVTAYKAQTYDTKGTEAIVCELPPPPIESKNKSSNIALSVDGTRASVLCLFETACSGEASMKEMTANFVKNEAKKCNVEHYTIGKKKKKKSSKMSMFGSWSRKSSTDMAVVEVPKEDTVTVDDFELLQVVGKGAFGKVFLVRRKNREKTIYAMKVLLKSHIFHKNQVEHTAAERRILAGIDHPYLVRLRYAFQTSKKLYMVMDYYAGGSLFFHLRKQRRFSIDQARFYSAQLCLALTYLHSHDIVYRDIKLENILMDKLGHIHLTDFGLSKEGVTEVNSGAQTFCGTAEYVAPELLHHKPYGKAADWWSFGILVYEMITGKTPFYSKNRSQMFQAITHTPVAFPLNFPPEAADLIEKLLQKDPLERLGIDGVQGFKTHPFFACIDWAKLEKKEMLPPYKPNVQSETSTTYVHKVFLKEAPVDVTPGGGKDVGEGDKEYEMDRHFADFDFFNGGGGAT
jgi:serum/glucocorticoid-regulated kinase 2